MNVNRNQLHNNRIYKDKKTNSNMNERRNKLRWNFYDCHFLVSVKEKKYAQIKI